MLFNIYDLELKQFLVGAGFVKPAKVGFTNPAPKYRVYTEVLCVLCG
jgi:hypothetical protein